MFKIDINSGCEAFAQTSTNCFERILKSSLKCFLNKTTFKSKTSTLIKSKKSNASSHLSSPEDSFIWNTAPKPSPTCSKKYYKKNKKSTSFSRTSTPASKSTDLKWKTKSPTSKKSTNNSSNDSSNSAPNSNI